jgi:pimeloyl-ACP methyl ester carboxylesterase
MKKEQNLAVVTIDGAGHISPHDQPDAVVQVVERWTRGGAAAVWKMT